MRAGWLTVLLLIPACGDDSSGNPGVDAAPGVCDLRSEVHARFFLIGDVAAGGPQGNQASGQYLEHPLPQLIDTIAEEGGCRFVAPRPALCEPACGGEEVCDVHGRCVGYPATLPAGTLTITGTNPPLTLEPQRGGSYYVETTYPDFYQAGDVIGFDLAGAAGIGRITTTVIGVPALALPTDQLTAIEHQDLTIAWTAIPEPAAAEVIVHLDSDHHGIPAYAECVAPASAGSVTMPAAILDRLILAGETGIGTFIENAWIEVRQRSPITTERGCAAVDAYADHFLSVETVRAR